MRFKTGLLLEFTVRFANDNNVIVNFWGVRTHTTPTVVKRLSVT